MIKDVLFVTHRGSMVKLFLLNVPLPHTCSVVGLNPTPGLCLSVYSCGFFLDAPVSSTVQR